MNDNYQFAVITNNNQESKKIALVLKQKLKKIKAKENNLYPDIVFIIGGDGTFLKAVSKYNQQLKQVKFITFKQGKLSFYYNFLVTEIDKVIKALVEKNEKLIINELDLLEITANNKTFYAINEFRLFNFSQTLSCEVYINNQLLQFFSGSGIIISTKTGTTGLMKSAGGSIILANAKLMEYQELFPVNNNIYHSIRAPLILDENQVITLKLKDYYKEKETNIKLVIDTFNFYDKLISDIKIKISNQTLKVFTFKNNTNGSLIERLNKSFVQF